MNNAKLNELTGKIKQWSYDRNLNSMHELAQFDKLVEEFGELVSGLQRQDTPLIEDSVGDMYVVLVVMHTQLDRPLPEMYEDDLVPSTVNITKLLAHLGTALENEDVENTNKAVSRLLKLIKLTAEDSGVNFLNCVELAYDEIKDRKGRIVDGSFIKEEDLIRLGLENPESKMKQTEKRNDK